MAPMALRREAWQRLAGELDLAKLDAITREISLGEAIQAGHDILEAKIRGRVVVNVARH
ncbi:Acrylyl-CoA reductase AcuI [compost metagenome]